MKTAFVMEIGLGHTTFYKHLQAAVAMTPDVEATWLPITFEGSDFLSRVPKLRNDIVLRGGLMARQKLGRSLRANQFDILFFHTQMTSVFCHKFMQDIPAVISMDATPKQFLDAGPMYGITPNAALDRRRDRWYRRAFKAASHLVTWSNWAKASLVNDYSIPAEKVTTISPGVDLDVFRPDAAARPNDGVVRLLFVGGDFARKGGDLLLKWARQTSVKTSWEVHLVTRDVVPETPGVFVHRGLTNNSRELVRLYQHSDLFVLPTRADCYSLAAMEAMATGMPVVITDIGGISELVVHGETGYIIAPDSYEDLAAYLDLLVTDAAKRQTLGAAGLSRAAKLFNGSQAMACELTLLRRLAQGLSAA